jgi:hypothetical protein
MSGEFFGRLEAELRTAAERPPRRLPDRGATGVALAAVALVAIALVPALLVLGGGESTESGSPPPPAEPAPVGTVIEKGTGSTFPRDVDHTVVATGVAPVSGPWQMETYASTRLADPDTGEEFQPAGLPCLGVALLDPPEGEPSTFGGGCGEFRGSPDFGRRQQTVPSVVGQGREILVYGEAPEEAVAVRVTADGGVRIERPTHEGPPGVTGDFYLVPVPPDLENGRVAWIDRDGKASDRDFELLPP